MLYTNSVDCFAASKTCTLQINQSLIETIPEESWADKSFIPDKSEWTITVAGLLVNINDTYEGTHPYDFINDRRTAYSFHFEELRKNKYIKTYSGKCYLTQATLEARKENIATYSCTFRGTGPLTHHEDIKMLLRKVHPMDHGPATPEPPIIGGIV